MAMKAVRYISLEYLKAPVCLTPTKLNEWYCTTPLSMKFSMLKYPMGVAAHNLN